MSSSTPVKSTPINSTPESQNDSNEQDVIDEHWMNHAFSLAEQAKDRDEVPVGAVLVLAAPDSSDENEARLGKLIGQGFNQSISSVDATAHAEINAIRDACKRMNNYRLPDTTLYVTLEPCAMCAGAIVHSRIGRVVIATYEPRAGSAGSVLNVLQNEHFNHHCDVSIGLMQEKSSYMLKAFFKSRRKAAKSLKA